MYVYIYIYTHVYTTSKHNIDNTSNPQRTQHNSYTHKQQVFRQGCPSVRPFNGSGGWKRTLVGVPWRGSVSARLAWGDVVSFNTLSKVLKMLSMLRWQGT